jgi:hypothetical protein
MRFLLSLFLIVLISCGKQEDFICSTFMPEVSDRYMFPVRPGTLEWGQLTSGQEKIDALQLPNNVLKNISTYGLVETCFDYPLLSSMMAFDTIQYGLERQILNFNGFHELVNRTDAARIMLSRYKQINPECIPQGGEIIAGDYSLSFVYNGMVQSQFIFIEYLTSIERRELIAKAVSNYNQMKLIGDPYGIINLKIEALQMSRAMIAERYDPFLKEMKKNPSIEIFVKYVELNNNVETLNTILDYANEF